MIVADAVVCTIVRLPVQVADKSKPVLQAYVLCMKAEWRAE